MDNPLFSIVVPTHNRANAVKDAVESALAQTMSMFEVIVVDDGSSVLPTFNGDPRVRLVRLPRNFGAGHARNVGVSLSRGSYITFLDDDDFLDPNFLRSVQELIESQGAVSPLVWSSIKFVSDVELEKVVDVRDYFDRGDDYVSAVTDALSIGVGFGLTVSRRVLNQIGGFDTSFRYVDDTELIIRLLCAGLQPTPLSKRYVVVRRLSGPHLTSSENDCARSREIGRLLAKHRVFLARHPFAAAQLESYMRHLGGTVDAR